MTGIGLTPEMRVLLVYLQERDVPPTFTEMEAATGRRRNSLSVSLKCLEERGYISRTPYASRSIKVLRRIEPKFRVILTPAQCEQRAEDRRASYARDEAA